MSNLDGVDWDDLKKERDLVLEDPQLIDLASQRDEIYIETEYGVLLLRKNGRWDLDVAPFCS